MSDFAELECIGQALRFKIAGKHRGGAVCGAEISCNRSGRYFVFLASWQFRDRHGYPITFCKKHREEAIEVWEGALGPSGLSERGLSVSRRPEGASAPGRSSDEHRAPLAEPAGVPA